MKHHGSLVKRVLLNNLLLFGATMGVVLIFICGYICHRQRIDYEQEGGELLKQYVWEVNSRMADGVAKSKSILTWPYLIDSLKKRGSNNYEKLDCSNNISVFMDSIVNDISIRVAIYVEENTMFQNKYVKYNSELENYGEIKKNICGGDGIYWEKELVRDTDGTVFLRFYTGNIVNDDCILECTIRLPDAGGSEHIKVKKKSETADGNYINMSINDIFSAVLTQDYTSLRIRQKWIVLSFGGIWILLMMIVIAVDYKVTREIFKGLVELLSELQMDAGNLAVCSFPVLPKEANEVVVIKKTLNALMERVKNIAGEQERLKSEKKNMEIYLLGKQLEPHMLYNSLSVIKLNADINHDEETISLVDDMIDYYRAILNKGDTFIRLEEEIRMIGIFLRINERNYGQKINYYYKISDELMGLKIPSMLLHTFVENSVVHGLGGKENPCRICILCYTQDGKVVITIEDNGYGISEEKLRQINGLEDTGYGIRNAFRRMQIAFGEDVSCHLESEPDKYTRVYLIFTKKE